MDWNFLIIPGIVIINEGVLWRQILWLKKTYLILRLWVGKEKIKLQ